MMFHVVDVDVVQNIVIPVPVSALFAVKTLELIINDRYMSKGFVKIIFN